MDVRNLSRKQAREILSLWNLSTDGRWQDLIAFPREGDDENYHDDFALYGKACPHTHCSLDVLSGFGGSGDESDLTEAICQSGHVSWFGPDGAMRTEQDVEQDCWRHQHAGPHPCPDCQKEMQEDLQRTSFSSESD